MAVRMAGLGDAGGVQDDAREASNADLQHGLVPLTLQQCLMFLLQAFS